MHSGMCACFLNKSVDLWYDDLAGFVSQRGVNTHLSVDHLDATPTRSRLLPPGLTHLHGAGYYTCPQLKNDLPDVFAQARKQGITTSLNPNTDGTGAWDGIPLMCPLLSVLVANDGEICAMTQQPATDSAPRDVVNAAQQILAWGCGLVIVTRGAHGATAYASDPRPGLTQLPHVAPTLYAVAVPAVPGVVVKDPTGAGDAFCAGLIVSLAHGDDVATAVAHGCRAGAAACQHMGGSTLATLAELEALAAAAATTAVSSGTAHAP